MLVADIELFPVEEGYLTPVRSGRVYYDEYVVITPKFSIPFNLIVSIIICLTMFGFLFCLVKQYIFGKINKLDNFEMIS